MVCRIRDELSTVDWTRSTRELADEYGCTKETVRTYRKRAGFERAQSVRNPVYESIDWSLSRREIALRYGLSFWTVRKWARRLLKGQKRKPTATPRKPKIPSLACSECGYLRPGVSNHRHHIIHRKDGGDDSLHNLVSLCPNCHAEAHAGFLTVESNVQVPAVGTRVSLMRVRRQYMDAVLLLDSFADQEPVGDDLVQESLEEARDLWDDTTDVTLRPRFTRT
jgi:5-methylcytosine-specific restriction endonuclease McrA